MQSMEFKFSSSISEQVEVERAVFGVIRSWMRCSCSIRFRRYQGGEYVHARHPVLAKHPVTPNAGLVLNFSFRMTLRRCQLTRSIREGPSMSERMLFPLLVLDCPKDTSIVGTVVIPSV